MIFPDVIEPLARGKQAKRKHWKHDGVIAVDPERFGFGRILFSMSPPRRSILWSPTIQDLTADDWELNP